MLKNKPDSKKIESLRQNGSLNPHPEHVIDLLFHDHDFFDPNDLVQMKYEMLRRVEVDKFSVSQAAAAFGLSRPTYYQAYSDYERGGLQGLIPKKPGPRAAHKFTPEIVEFIRSRREEDDSLRVGDLVALVRKRFGIVVHPNSVDRALRQEKKRHRMVP